MLAIWKLQDDAYSLSIREQVSSRTGQNWSLSSVYTPLSRLAKKRLVASSLSEPESKRGGRPKRIYTLTPRGRRALLEIRTVESAMWAGIHGLATEG